MKKKEKEKITLFLSSILENSNLFDYKIADIKNDYDVNFLIIPEIDSLDEDDKERFMFILYCSDISTLTIFCPSLYTLKDNDSIILTLNAINNVNSQIAVGKVYLNNKNDCVVSYVNRILFNDITKELTIDLLEEYANSFLITSIKFYEQMRILKND